MAKSNKDLIDLGHTAVKVGKKAKKLKKKHLLIIILILAIVTIGVFLYIHFNGMPFSEEQDEQTEEGNTSDYSWEGYTIGSFNCQKFGLAKMEDEKAMESIAKIVVKYDILAFQETQDASGEALKDLDSRIPSNYIFIVSERLGSSTNKEEYVYIYNKDTTQLLKKEVYPDPDDEFEREPYIAHFRKIGGEDFIVIQVHIKPSSKATPSEVKELAEVVAYAMRKYNDNDVIIVGDLNADCSYCSNCEKHLYMMEWVFDTSHDTTVGPTDCTYDRIIVSSSFEDNIESVGVYRFDLDYGLSQEEALNVSDHYPIYAVIR